jgi:hypothetical protein
MCYRCAPAFLLLVAFADCSKSSPRRSTPKDSAGVEST